MKYGAGDKVRLRADLEVGKLYGAFKYTESMYEVYKPSDVLTIRHKARTHDESYWVKGFGYAWWTDEMFEGLAEPEPEPVPIPWDTDWFEDLF